MLCKHLDRLAAAPLKCFYRVAIVIEFDQNISLCVIGLKGC